MTDYAQSESETTVRYQGNRTMNMTGMAFIGSSEATIEARMAAAIDRATSSSVTRRLNNQQVVENSISSKNWQEMMQWTEDRDGVSSRVELENEREPTDDY